MDSDKFYLTRLIFKDWEAGHDKTPDIGMVQMIVFSPGNKV